jgi:hypothetical protein
MTVRTARNALPPCASSARLTICSAFSSFAVGCADTVAVASTFGGALP